MALEGRRVSSKSPFKVRERDEGVVGRNYRDKCFPTRGQFALKANQLFLSYLASLIFDPAFSYLKLSISVYSEHLESFEDPEYDD